jgi:hypothetical protein
MPNASILVGGSDDPNGRQPTEGVVVAAPASGTALLRVAVPSFDSEQALELRWSGPRDGGALPSVGDACLVVWTKDGTAWAAVWWPS